MRRSPVMLVFLLVGCGGASPQTGITAYLRASNAQFVPGPMPMDTGNDEPKIRNFNVSNTTVYPGLENLSFSGTVEQGVSALMGIPGDSGYWIVQAPGSDPQTPTDYGFTTSLSFSPETPLGQQSLVLRGVDATGALGPPFALPLTVKAPTPSGALVFTLTWDTEADLDLHVVIPNPSNPSSPIEIWNRVPVGLPPLGPADPPYDSATAAAAPYLDMDSNANCVIDGRRQENVIFSLPPADGSFVPIAPPPGEYIVRVDTFSMCGQAAAQWELQVSTPDGWVVNPATWESTDSDTRGDHGAGAGRLAVDFTLPL